MLKNYTFKVFFGAVVSDGNLNEILKTKNYSTLQDFFLGQG